MISREYQCPFFKSCLCDVLWKFQYDLVKRTYSLWCNKRHTGQSHANHRGKFLDPFQQEVVSRAVHIDPNITGAKIIRNLTNVDDERVQIDHGLKASVDRLVRHERDAVFTKVLGGVKVGGPSCEEVKKLSKYCKERRFDNAIT